MKRFLVNLIRQMTAFLSNNSVPVNGQNVAVLFSILANVVHKTRFVLTVYLIKPIIAILHNKLHKKHFHHSMVWVASEVQYFHVDSVRDSQPEL